MRRTLNAARTVRRVNSDATCTVTTQKFGYWSDAVRGVFVMHGGSAHTLPCKEPA
jgi:hypothetical protein